MAGNAAAAPIEVRQSLTNAQRQRSGEVVLGPPIGSAAARDPGGRCSARAGGGSGWALALLTHTHRRSAARWAGAGSRLRIAGRRPGAYEWAEQGVAALVLVRM